MAIIRAFKAVVYNASKAGRVKDVLAPPYDVISPRMQDELYGASPYNIVRLILGKEHPGDNERDNKYTRAGRLLSDWLKVGILVQDKEPAIYAYRQDYKEDGATKTRLGFIALMKLEDFSKRGILPHENTFKAPKEDRFRLINEVEANLSPIFSLYRDPRHLVKKLLMSQSKKTRPAVDVHLEGARHRMWRLTDGAIVKRIESAMRDKTIFIADGHHRYEVALQFREKMRGVHGGAAGPYDYVMMYFTDMDPKGLTILAAHRVIKEIGPLGAEAIVGALRKYFLVKRLDSAKEIFTWLKRSKNLSRQFALYIDKKAYSIKLRDEKFLNDVNLGGKSRQWKTLDVSILHHLILRKVLGISDEEGSVVYTRDPKEAILLVDRGGYKTAFLLNPTKISQVESIASNKELMPHKSTYFYPKLLSGLVINRLT